MKTNVIKLQFVNQGVVQGREYTYFSEVDVEVGETVNIDGKKQGVITQINVPVAEIEKFKDKAKTIMGKIEINVGDRVKVITDNGKFLGEGTIVNINEFREPSLKYAVNADFYDVDYIFVGEENLVKILEVIENVK